MYGLCSYVIYFETQNIMFNALYVSRISGLREESIIRLVVRDGKTNPSEVSSLLNNTY